MIALALAAAPAVQAQSADVVGGARDSVRVMRHPNGARSIYSRQSNMKGMRCSTYHSDGRLVAVNDYIEGRNGELVACNIYDHTKRNIIYRVADNMDFANKQKRFGNHVPLVYGDYVKELVMMGEAMGLEVVTA